MKIVALLALVALAGCSLTMTSPPDPPYETVPDCTTSAIAPIGDVAGIVASAVGVLAFGISGSADHDHGESAVAVASAVAMVGFAASAIHGFRLSSACSDARASYAKQRPAPMLPSTFGVERGACRAAPEPPCDPGLVCASKRCVVWPPR